jgi:hypothetical protein
MKLTFTALFATVVFFSATASIENFLNICSSKPCKTMEKRTIKKKAATEQKVAPEFQIGKVFFWL